MTQQATQTARLYEEYLVTLAMGGDRQALHRLAARYQPRLLRTARRQLGDTELARVAVQEAWLAILRGLARLHDPARFAPYAFGVLHRRCIDAIRTAQRERRLFDGEDQAGGTTAASHDEGLAIRQAMAALPPDQRLAAQLHFVEGLTLEEIAGVQQVPLGTAKSRLFHARQKLKAALTAPELEGEVP